MCTKVAVGYGLVTEVLKQLTRNSLCESKYPSFNHHKMNCAMVRYYLAVTSNLVGWKSTLHAQGPDGPVAVMMTKANLVSSLSDILIESLSDKWTTRLRQDNFLGTNHKFVGREGRQYCWKWSNAFSLGNDLQVCVCTISPSLP